jgi:transposase InsO family protein
MADPRVHDADLGVHEHRSRCSRSSDPAVHDAPILAFTIGRNPHIEVFYNRKRRHSAIGMVSPAEFEKAFTERQAA